MQVFQGFKSADGARFGYMKNYKLRDFKKTLEKETLKLQESSALNGLISAYW
tara:strand:- start:10345 stop:10500 length:156 start_codon:yes stop_codon:yes gene_type:complete